jgi:biopolymer transport protein ExbB
MLTEKIFTVAQSGAEVILWLLLLISILSIAAIIERFFTLGGIRRKSKQTSQIIREALQSNNLEEIEDISKDRDSLEGRALSYGLRYQKENGSDGLAEVFNSYSLLERQGLERNLSFLATVGSNAPFVGLLGTVLGIMKAFNDLGSSAGDAQAIMVGIAEALVATAVGLLVALPAVVAYNSYQKQVRNILQNLESVKELCLAYSKRKRV